MLLGDESSEAEVPGASVWLWMHSSQHHNLSLHCVPTVLLPVIKRQQYMPVSQRLTPLFLSAGYG